MSRQLSVCCITGYGTPSVKPSFAFSTSTSSIMETALACLVFVDVDVDVSSTWPTLWHSVV